MDLEISMSLILLFLGRETLNKSRFFLQKFKKIFYIQNVKTFVSAHKLVQIIILIVIGIVINRLLADLAIHFELPLYLDSVGTIVVAVIGGFSPGAIVGFLTNFIGGFVDSSTFYYGTINVMIAVCAGIAAKRGAFNRITRLPLLLGMLMILSIPCSVLSYFLLTLRLPKMW